MTSVPGDGTLRPFDESLPHMLLRARESSMAFFRPMLAANDFTEQQWRVLRALNNSPEPPDMGMLAELTVLLAPSLSRIVANLAQRGFITREVDSSDQRRTLVALTPSGRSAVEDLAPVAEAHYADIETKFGARRLAQLFDLLEELTALRPSPD